jgi:hypothetical protein
LWRNFTTEDELQLTAFAKLREPLTEVEDQGGALGGGWENDVVGGGASDEPRIAVVHEARR